MKLLIPNQAGGDEFRVSLVPQGIRSLVPTHEIWVESGAGTGAGYSDDAYVSAAAQVVDSETAWSQADLVLVVRPPELSRVKQMKRESLLVGFLRPLDDLPYVQAVAETGITGLALELLPRITRAQAMDALSSQANLAGYRAVILAAERLQKIFPMMMTAAGTLQPAKVFVIGAGVAGLQAIATARRLGAVVSAYDVRPTVKEQVQSVGGKFVELPLEVSTAQEVSGYASAQSVEQQQKQAELMARVIAESDVVISTALVPGKPAPRLIPASAVRKMSPGSVIVDLAAEKGGNCEWTVPGQVVQREGITIVGYTNLASQVPTHASLVYSNNLIKLLGLILDKHGQLKLDLSDEIISGLLVCQNGKIVHPLLTKMLQPSTETGQDHG